MRKPLAVLATLAVCLTFGLAPAFAVGIAGTKHDLSTAGYGSTELCVFCHDSHGALASTSGPMWNHKATTAVYTLYGGGVTSKGTVVNTPGPASMSCLSCHDGTVAVDSFGGATGTHLMTGVNLVNTDLRDDHPIGVAYPATGTAYKMPPTTAALFNNRVECASCHNSHDNTYGKFLRMSNAGSLLCLNCHSK